MAYTAPIPVFMNKDKWNSISKEDQEIIEKINEEWVEKQANLWNKLDKEADGIRHPEGYQDNNGNEGAGCPGGRKNESCMAEWVKKTAAKGLPAQEAWISVSDICTKRIRSSVPKPIIGGA